MTAPFVPSPLQQAFFDWIKNGTGSCILEAKAGTGKTTTLVHALDYMDGSIFLGAFNKKIAEEIKARVPVYRKVFVATMHSAGFSSWRFACKGVAVNERKMREIYRGVFPPGLCEVLMTDLEPSILELVSLAKQSAFGVLKSPHDQQAWLDLIDHFDIDTLENTERVIEVAQEMLQRSIDMDSRMIDFDDMIYAPLIHNSRVFENDWVLIDEAQDTNAARRALALRMLKRGGRLVAVGDRNQAIYGFSGADSDSIDLLKDAVNATTLPLNVTYRCPKAVVRYANQWVKDLIAHPSAPEGSVTNLDLNDKNVDFTQHVKGGDVILCRFNAPLIDHVYKFIAKGIAAKVEGREIGLGLKVLVRRWKAKSFGALRDRLDEFLVRETAKFRAREEESRAAAVEDKVRCIGVIIERIESTHGRTVKNPIEAVCDEIDAIFADNANGGQVILCSIHKSKGREWEHVFWLQTGPSKWARKQWEKDQEDNLCYVAATRAKRELTLVQQPKRDKKEEKTA